MRASLCIALAAVQLARAGPCVGNSSNLPPDQCAAWQALYDASSGPLWDACWDLRDRPCDCNMTCGQEAFDNTCVTCEYANGSPTGALTITTLELTNNGLRGTLPSLRAMSDLRELDLILNRLGGRVPSFANMTKLWSVGLSYNEFTEVHAEDLICNRHAFVSGMQLTFGGYFKDPETCTKLRADPRFDGKGPAPFCEITQCDIIDPTPVLPRRFTAEINASLNGDLPNPPDSGTYSIGSYFSYHKESDSGRGWLLWTNSSDCSRLLVEHGDGISSWRFTLGDGCKRLLNQTVDCCWDSDGGNHGYHQLAMNIGGFLLGLSSGFQISGGGGTYKMESARLDERNASVEWFGQTVRADRWIWNASPDDQYADINVWVTGPLSDPTLLVLEVVNVKFYDHRVAISFRNFKGVEPGGDWRHTVYDRAGLRATCTNPQPGGCHA